MAWLFFCRRDFLVENGIEFLPIISEDELFSFAVFCTAERYYVLNDALYVYRKRNGSIMKNYNVDRLVKGLNGMIVGSIYVNQILDMLPRVEGYDAWREDVTFCFFERFLRNHIEHFYKDPKMFPTVTKIVTQILSPIFGENTPFVQFFFDYFHMYKLKIQMMFKENRQLEYVLNELNDKSSALFNIMTSIKSNAKRILLMGTPRHGNLGDHAIVLGELHVLKKFFPEHKVIEIPYDYLTEEIGEMLFGLVLSKYVRRDDIIFLPGGGNLGNLWVNEEELRRKLIEKFPQNKIVIFPQSIHFTDDDNGRRELATSQKIYNAHRDLHLMTRDDVSFNFAKEFFPQVNHYLLPDSATVFFGITDGIDVARQGVLFILRGDKEKVRDDADIQHLQNYLTARNIPFETIDTVIDGKVTADDRDSKVCDVLIKIRGSKLVITDRFHGVVFSFVTRTPVLAFKSFDTKISSGIKWFKDIPSIFYAEDQNWSRVENFIDMYCIADASNLRIAVNVEELFYQTLNQIVRTRETHSVELSASYGLSREECVVKIFTLHIPLSICNFRCHYCYLAQRAESYQGIQPEMKYSPEQVARALSPKRLGGKAYFNICAEGETLLLKDLDAYVKLLATDGHFIEIVTNCTITPMLEKILSWDKKLLQQIEFKCSFHYLELKKRNMLERFAANVNKIWDAGASACVEITPSDELIPYIDEVKEFSLKNFGALPHITIARDDRTQGIDILSRLSKEEYYKTWGQFDSIFFDYKASIFGKRQEEFCYAGLWSAFINMATGQARACYCGRNLGDVFANPDSEFPTWPVGKCTIAHCYNGHFWLTFGNIPDATPLTYADMRNRVRADGREWLQPKLKEGFSSKLQNENPELSDAEKLKYMTINLLGLS